MNTYMHVWVCIGFTYTVFYYQSRMADVVQVDKTAYAKCEASNPIRNYSKEQSYAFERNEISYIVFVKLFMYVIIIHYIYIYIYDIIQLDQLSRQI